MSELENILELIIKAQSGDDKARETILYAYRYIVSIITKKYIQSDIPQEDLTQVGMIALNSAISSFDINAKASFPTYATTCINNAILDSIRAAKNAPINTPSLEDLDALYDNIRYEPVFPDSNPEEDALVEERKEFLYNAIKDFLNAEDYEIIRLYLLEKSHKQISEELDVTQKHIEYVIAKVKKHLEQIKGNYNN